MDEKKTIVIASNAYPPNFYGGAELIAESHARALMRQGHNVVVFAPDTTGNHAAYTCYEENYNGVTVCRICVPGEHFDVTTVCFFDRAVDQAFQRLVEKYQPDVLHCQNMIGSSLGIIEIAKQNGMKVFVTLHDYWGVCYKNTLLLPDGGQCTDCTACAECMPYITRRGVDYPMRMRKAYFDYIFSMVDCFISPSQYLADRYIEAGFASERMRAIWNGIDYERFEKIEHIPSDKVRFTFAGYLGSHKGIHQILFAMTYLRNLPVELNLVGDGGDRPAYEKFVEAHNLTDRVHFWGKLQNDEMDRAYAKTDVYILASVWPENQPVSITEALACGIPVITANLGGSLELVKNGLNGYVYNAYSSVDLAECMRKLAENPALRRSLGKNGQLAMQHNTFDRQIQKILALYDTPLPKASLPGHPIIVEGSTVPEAVTSLGADYLPLMRDWLEDAAFDTAEAIVVTADAETDGRSTAELTKHTLPLILPKALEETLGTLPEGGVVLTYQQEDEIPALLAEARKSKATKKDAAQ